MLEWLPDELIEMNIIIKEKLYSYIDSNWSKNWNTNYSYRKENSMLIADKYTTIEYLDYLQEWIQKLGLQKTS